MDMEIDIPLPEELELLEAESHFYEEESFPEPPSPGPSPRAPPKSPPSTAGINGLKRSLEVEELDAASEESKRSKSEQDSARVEVQIDDEKEDEEEEEEEWLRYSPAPERDLRTDADGGSREEVSLSRYVSNIDGDCVPITAPSGGDRVYAKIYTVESEIRLKKLDIRGQSKEIISEPFNVLLQKAEQQAFTKALNASSESHDLVLAGTPAANEQLWVDKYAPSSFTELLSDELTNREVLLWLKQWDSCVFGSEIRSTSDDVLSALRRHSTTQYQRSFDSKFSNSKGYRWKNGSYRKSANSGNGNDELKGIQGLMDKKSRVTGPPEQKILLLCGPPGLGKTTLAHVAAQHCGYRVVEVNASDDRSSSTIEAKILDVVQMNSVMADSKPKCLVIDEIDGALGDGKGAVEVLLKMVSERKSNMGKENVGKDEKTRKTSSKKQHKSASLSRPVICICNDLYAPVLRPLRQVAKVHVFVQPTVSRIVSRLKYICNKEGTKTSSIALTALAEYNECDIRSCLNTLQFLNKKQEALNVMEISSQAVGRKDISRSTFDVWKEIFQKRKSKREREPTSSRNSRSGDFDFLHSLIASRGDYDTIMDGIYENLLQLQYHDPVMQKTVKCLNYLGVFDRMQRYIMQSHQMQLQVYHPSAAVALHHLVAQIQKPHIEWPKSYQRCRTMLMERTDTLRSWHHGISPYISRHLSIKSFVEDFISPLLHILSPPSLRPVALHLLSENEKNDLAQLVNVMVSYSISYKNEKPDFRCSLEHEAMETSALSLYPPINEFVSYKYHRWNYHILPLPMKQILLQEVEKQKILQVSTIKSFNATEGSNKGKNDSVGEAFETAAKVTNVGVEGKNKDLKNTSNMRNNGPHTTTSASISGSCRSSTTTTGQTIPEVAVKRTNSFCFFDRFRKAGIKGSENANVTGRKEATYERDIRPVIFKFNEGYTNAVKRPVRMREFLV